ncbi:MAG: 16S rRNA (uracil(1498)-N(3))-methyltransferase [Spirochaetaceae bacterium]|jgi:16S rRNA (uracil1498-N3)-methyltransferase|nr:16S rRNA (uracil(1498)-N(3))-methyltransferase [Spirochaetaceae bacterium]
MKQFILPGMPDSGGRVCITGRDFHYLVHVKRLRPGAVLNALLPSGEPVKVRIVSMTEGCLTGERLLPQAAGPEETGREPQGSSLPPLILFQGLPKGAKMDRIICQAAEGGVTEIAPFISAYSVSRPDDSGGRLERWRRIIREARQQSGSGTATRVRAAAAFDELLEYWEELKRKYERPVGLLFHQTPLEQGSFHEYLNNHPDLVVLAVGPEGGFSPEEVSRCMSAGFKPLTMGETVLRTETAALYAQAAIRIILVESALWMPRVSR